jgi:hypothetical protein
MHLPQSTTAGAAGLEAAGAEALVETLSVVWKIPFLGWWGTSALPQLRRKLALSRPLTAHCGMAVVLICAAAMLPRCGV